MADAPPDSNSSQADTDISSISDATESSNVTSIPAYDFNLMGDIPEAKDVVSAALMTTNQNWKLYHRLIILLFSILLLWFTIINPLLNLLRIYLGNTSLLIHLVLLPHHLREPVIPPLKTRERTPEYSTLYYHLPLLSVCIEDAVIDSYWMVLS